MIRSLSGALVVASLALAGCFSPVDELTDGGPFGGGGGGSRFDGGTGGGGGSSCDGCRLATGTCVPRSATSVVNCGSGGAQCVACLAGQLCSAGLCTGGLGGGAGGGTGGGGFGGGTGGGGFGGGTGGGGFGGGTGGGFGGGTGGGFGGGSGGGGSFCDGCRLPSGTCVPFTSTSVANCGANGSACVACSSGQICSGGICMSPTRKRVGDPCVGDGECQVSLGSSAICKRTTSSGNATYLGGYCTLRCTSTSTQCPVGSTCVSVVASFGESDSLCWDNCSAGDACRSPGYTCYGIGNLNACWISPLPPVGGGAGGGTGGGVPVGGGAGGGMPVGGGGGGFCDGCFVNGVCIARVSSNNDTYCGQGGVICQTCAAAGMVCSNYQCINPPVGGGGGGFFDGGFGGGAGGGGAFCDGCWVNGVCVGRVSSNSNLYCGQGGVTCQNCAAANLVCSNYQCISPPVGGGAGGGAPIGGGGGGAFCDGCWFSGTCITRANSNNDIVCGQGGVVCQACYAANLVCSNYQCINPPVGGGGGGFFDGGGFGGGTGGGFPTGGGGGSVACSAATCAGCCSNNFCVPAQSQSNLACGANGNQCATCVNGLTCSGGACVVLDGGASQVGNACTADTQCRPPTNGFCIAETVFGQPTGWPGGACSASCNGVACPVGSSCLDVGGGSTGTNPICFKSCPSPRLGQSTCRTGYVCEVNVNVTGAGICIPRCNTVGFSCWQGTHCDANSGYCIAP